MSSSAGPRRVTCGSRDGTLPGSGPPVPLAPADLPSWRAFLRFGLPRESVTELNESSKVTYW
jgi:hypothetical protein